MTKLWPVQSPRCGSPPGALRLGWRQGGIVIHWLRIQLANVARWLRGAFDSAACALDPRDLVAEARAAVAAEKAAALAPASLLEAAKPGEVACWHCRVLIDGAMAAHNNANHQRRLLRFLNLPPFFPTDRGPICLFHTVMAVAADDAAIARRLAS